VPVLFALLAVATASLVAVSPLGLRAFAGPTGEWSRLSLIGQTYGAVSALIAGLALAGVAVTLVFQARETRRAADEGRRQAMADLLTMAMESPVLDACWGPPFHAGTDDERRQQIYLNLIVTQWGTAFRSGVLPAERLRGSAERMFLGAPGRAYWAVAGPARTAGAATRADRAFTAIMQEAYESALTRSPEPRSAPGVPDTGGDDRTGPGAGPVLLAAFAAGGALVAGAAVIGRAAIPRIGAMARERRSRPRSFLSRLPSGRPQWWRRG
jgi:hypothetical protein